MLCESKRRRCVMKEPKGEWVFVRKYPHVLDDKGFKYCLGRISTHKVGIKIGGALRRRQTLHENCGAQEAALATALLTMVLSRPGVLFGGGVICSLHCPTCHQTDSALHIFRLSTPDHRR